MLKRTPGKWDWIFVGEDGTLKTVIAVKDEINGNMTFEFVRMTLKPTVGDLMLVRNAPEMHELIYEFIDEVDEAISQGGIFTERLHKMRWKASALLAEINVERTNPPCK